MQRRTKKRSYNQRLREERLNASWSQQDLANRLGTTINNVSRWELGQTLPGPYFRAKLCALFDKSEEELGLVEGNPTTTTREEAGAPPTQSSSEDEFALWTVPYPRNPHFTGRDEILNQLDHSLSPEGPDGSPITRRAALTQPQAIKGLGGIGKTQIAVEYAYRSREQGRYTHVLWINATNEETIMGSFVTLAQLLPAFPVKSETDQRKLVAAIIGWLEQCQHPWLLIFDNADDVALVQPYFPQQGDGSILLTTRANAIGAVASSIEVEKLNLMEGTHLLLRRAQRMAHACDDEINEASNLVVTLDCFPLALEQAGAYIEETQCDFSTYLQLYQEHRPALLARRGTQTSQYPDSVAMTWSLSFQKVEQSNPAATELLRLCAFLAPDHIPEELLTKGAVYWPPLLQQAAANLFTFNQMFEVLLRFSLVKRLTEDHALSIHRLVQVVLVDTMEAEEQLQWAQRVVHAVNAVFPRDPKEEVASWPLCLRYLDQAQACNMLIQQYRLLFPEAADVLDRTGTYLREHALYPLAESLYQQALRIREHLLGGEHPEVATSLNGLAELYRNQGRYGEAESLFERALRIREHLLGGEHPEVATSLHGLADLYREQGRYGEAEPLFERALRIREHLLGGEHPEAATSLNGLAQLYLDQGKYAEAEPLLEQALHIRTQHLEPEHPEVATSLNNLAGCYVTQGRYTEAASAFEQALRIWEHRLGPEHPIMTAPLNNLASLYKEQGRYAEAEPLYQQAIRICELHLGQKHIIVAYPLNNLADIHREQRRYVEAERLYRRVLHIREQQLGVEHGLVAPPLNGLAHLYQEQGNDTEAESLYQRVLSISEETFKPRQPDTAEALHGLASLRETQGRLQEAASLYRRALSIREHVYGPQHARTIETGERLQAALVALDRDETAVWLGVGRQQERARFQQ